MRKYWYTILLTISLSGAAAARMIPDSVAEAVAAEIIDLGTDIRMRRKPLRQIRFRQTALFPLLKPMPPLQTAPAVPPLSQNLPHRNPSLFRKTLISPMCFLSEIPGPPAFPNTESWDRLRFLPIPA